MIEGLDHAQISIPTGKEDEARKFYCQFLGLREVEKPGNLKGRGGFWLDLGNAQVHVGAEDGIDRAKTKAHVAYRVSDLSYWRERFKENGTEIIEGTPIPGCDRFEFRDPFGNRVEMIQRL
jgi:catechol 2,3-dioxygenase-like lactoylglutathione lyase family enzyme